MERFLLIFDSILNPIINNIDNSAFYFDPGLTPKSILPWLASWVDLYLDPTWSLQQHRELVKKAAELYRWRGTRLGLSEYLTIYTGVTPEIIEFVPGMILGTKTMLGENTVLGSSGSGHHFEVVIEANAENVFDIKTVRNIIDSQKPAHTQYTLRVTTRS